MNYRSLLSPFLLIFLGVASFSCSDDDEGTPNTPPAISITSPTEAEFLAGFDRGQSITIIGTVEDDKEVSSIKIEASSGGAVLYSNEDTSIDEKTVTLNQSVDIPSIAPAGNYRIVLTATDSEGASSTAERNFVLR